MNSDSEFPTVNY